MSSSPAGTSQQPGSLDPTRAQLWQAARGPVTVGALVLAAALVIALLSGRPATGALDPRAVDREGSRAVAELLRDQGVQVDLVETTDAVVAAVRAGTTGAGGSTGSGGSDGAAQAPPTLLVTQTGRLARVQLQRVRETGADLVLVDPTPTALDELAPGVERLGPAQERRREPDCELPAARRAGDADVAVTLYAVTAPPGGTAVLCYGGEIEDAGSTRPAAPLVQLRTPAGPSAGPQAGSPGERDRAGGRTVTVLGDAAPLSNDRLDDRGNAALALGLLGTTPRLVWYLPARDDVPLAEPGQAVSPLQLVPSRLWYATVMLAVALVLLALWRGRRLGPVVPEPLPVVVRSAETTEGRARLYRRVRARDRAADALRHAARQRLLPALGLARGAEPAQVVAAVADRSGRPAPDVAALLHGGAPADDAGLVRLADELDDLEREVRQS